MEFCFERKGYVCMQVEFACTHYSHDLRSLSGLFDTQCCLMATLRSNLQQHAKSKDSIHYKDLPYIFMMQCMNAWAAALRFS